MNKLEQAARQALEALVLNHYYNKTKQLEAITALREALAEQAEQEPVAWGVFEGNLHDMFFEQSEAEYIAKCKGGDAVVKPLYAAPVRTKDLTDDEIQNAILKFAETVSDKEVFGSYRAVIAADREKNK